MVPASQVTRHLRVATVVGTTPAATYPRGRFAPSRHGRRSLDLVRS